MLPRMIFHWNQSLDQFISFQSAFVSGPQRGCGEPNAISCSQS
jgi:hypothetical protein